MTLNELMGMSYEASNLPVYILGGVALVGAVALALRRAHQGEDYSLHAQGVAVRNAQEEDGYRKVSLAQAKTIDDDVEVTGSITDWARIDSGFREYSGIISDGTTCFPFNTGNMYYDEAGVLPLMLKDAVNTKAPMTMRGSYDKDLKAFFAEGVKYTLNGETYEL